MLQKQWKVEIWDEDGIFYAGDLRGDIEVIGNPPAKEVTQYIYDSTNGCNDSVTYQLEFNGCY